MAVVHTERIGAIGYLTLSRPDRLNAMGKAFWTELPAAVAELDADPEVRVIVMRAEGRHFSAGLDLTEANALFDDGRSPAERNMRLFTHIKELQRSFQSLDRCSTPTVAAIHGACIGGGVDLVAACDIRICSADASFSIRETKIAIVADLGSLQRLPSLIPRSALMELALTGRDFDAMEALQWGFVSKVCESHDMLVSHAEKVAEEIASNSPLVTLGVRRLLR
ncbi:MAG: enoyl-CoA hydratase-related protein, partial [Acidimicrobiales bacterium]